MGLLLGAADPSSNVREAAQTGSPSSIADSLKNISERYDQDAKLARATAIDEARCSQRNYGSNSDLCAQWKAADAARDAAEWACWSIWVGVAGTIGLMINLVYTRKAVLAAEAAAKGTNEATVAMGKQTTLMAQAQRPWLSFDARLLRVNQSPAPETTAILTLRLDVTNHSAFVAHLVRGYGKASLENNALDRIVAAVDDRQVTENWLNHVGNNIESRAIFPNGSDVIDVTIEVRNPRQLGDRANSRLIVGVGYNFDGGTGKTILEADVSGVREALEFMPSGSNGPKMTGELRAERALFVVDKSSVRAT